MPEQFSYPEAGWSTGEMRKAGKSPILDVMEGVAKRSDPSEKKKKLPPGVEFVPEGEKFPDDWEQITRVDGGYHVKRSLEKASPKELREMGVGDANSPR